MFLKLRDWKIIRETFTKFTTKIPMRVFGMKEEILKSFNYRQYNQAFYEEIIIDYHVESRVAQNYRERFLSEPHEIYLVLEMYSKQDYVNHFLSMELDQISKSQLIELFKICLN
mgnify:CR=1 FL=1